MEDKSKTIAELVSSISGLVTLPDVFVKINQLVDDPNSTLYDIADVISRDPAFTAHLLKLANSSFYSYASRIDTVLKAVSVIGTSQIRNLALSLSVARTFSALPNQIVSMENFWRHSLLCALSARFLARLAKKCDAEALFTAGLLHDVGELILFNRLPDVSRSSLEVVLDEADQIPIHVVEQEKIGFDHAQLGGELARQWCLPPLLAQCICYHHEPLKASSHKREAAIIHIANTLALLAEIQSIDLADAPEIEPEIWALTGLDVAVVPEVVAQVQQEIIETEKLFLG